MQSRSRAFDKYMQEVDRRFSQNSDNYSSKNPESDFEDQSEAQYRSEAPKVFFL